MVVRLIMLVLFLTGCASTKEPIVVKTYNEQSINNKQLAIIKPVAFIRVSAINGDNNYDISPSSGFTNEFEIEFIPGNHKLLISYFNGVSESYEPILLEIAVKKGRKYIIKPFRDAGYWKPQLIDVTNKPQCWSIDVGTFFGPKGCE